MRAAATSCGFNFRASTNFRRACAQQFARTIFAPAIIAVSANPLLASGNQYEVAGGFDIELFAFVEADHCHSGHTGLAAAVFRLPWVAGRSPDDLRVSAEWVAYEFESSLPLPL